MMTPPKLFISYSWSNPTHEQWVVDLAEELVSSGVDVVLDKWDLREGHDSIAFMEKSVTDSSINKVALICDKIYTSKANDRSGGVGTETQIISPEIYKKQDQNKFVAIIVERDENGNPFLPAYYKSRIFIDLSESEKYSENYEKLLRWIFNKPLHVKPVIGAPPSFITTSDPVVLGTTHLAKRVIEGLKQDKGYTRGAIDEYFVTLSENFERLRIIRGEKIWDEEIFDSIENFTPIRNEYINVLTTLCQYSDPMQHAYVIRKFLESLIPYLSRPPNTNSWREGDYDNFKFVIHELFLYTIAILTRGDNIDTANYLLSSQYFVPDDPRNAGDNSTQSFTVFRDHVPTLEARNQRLNLRRLSLRADLIEQRSKSSGVQFRHIMQADFICYLRVALNSEKNYERWFPETLVYATRHHGQFEIFARSKSRAYLLNILPILGGLSLEELQKRITALAASSLIPSWQYESFNPSTLSGIDELGMKP